MKWKPKIIDLVLTSIGGYIISLILDQVLFIGLREKIRFTSSSLQIDRPRFILEIVDILYCPGSSGSGAIRLVL